MVSMKIVVQGLWHLGCVTAACCSRHFDVAGLDFDAAVIAGLSRGEAPLHEPGLNDLIAANMAAGRLRFSTSSAEACAGADILWLTYDTPVNDNDESDAEFVLNNLKRALPYLRAGAIVLISSQLAIGTCRALEKEFPQYHFASSPENLRLGKAIDAFEKAERIIAGVRTDEPKAALARLLSPFTPNIIYMRTESAEMVKHAINSFLALSITFINEIARIGEYYGADAMEVSKGLKSEPRIGPKAYLMPGGAFAGGTLARDVVTLSHLAARKDEEINIIPAIKASNDRHREWAFERLAAKFGDLRGKTIAVLGLVYTPGTNTLRRSSAVELCRRLAEAGATVRAHDPAIKQLPPELSMIRLAQDVPDALRGAAAIVICTEWPAYRELDWPAALSQTNASVILDANRFLEKQFIEIKNAEYISVGRAGNFI